MKDAIGDGGVWRGPSEDLWIARLLRGGRPAARPAFPIAAMILTTETLVTDIPEKDPASASARAGHVGDMAF
ncbi:MAG TPA: hypothetical protein VEY67_09255 [Candidatus Dormibacteraeota bacterium]|nr:hypothetical protein [Candidatus Dormibacteraeota bacterium]